jgi:hypothetical protein
MLILYIIAQILNISWLNVLDAQIRDMRRH